MIHDSLCADAIAAASDSNQRSGLPLGVVVGLSCGGVAVVGACVCAAALLLRKRNATVKANIGTTNTSTSLLSGEQQQHPSVSASLGTGPVFGNCCPAEEEIASSPGVRDSVQ